MSTATATKQAKAKPAKEQVTNTRCYYTYLVDFNTLMIAKLAEEVTQYEAKRVAAETDCGDNQLIVVSHKAWDWKSDEINEAFLPLTIRKMTV